MYKQMYNTYVQLLVQIGVLEPNVQACVQTVCTFVCTFCPLKPRKTPPFARRAPRMLKFFYELRTDSSN